MYNSNFVNIRGTLWLFVISEFLVAEFLIQLDDKKVWKGMKDFVLDGMRVG